MGNQGRTGNFPLAEGNFVNGKRSDYLPCVCRVCGQLQTHRDILEDSLFTEDKIGAIV